MTDNNNTPIPTWMNEQRPRRRGGYGRRCSGIGLGGATTGGGVGGIRSTGTKIGRSRRNSALFGTPAGARTAASALDFDQVDEGEPLDGERGNAEEEDFLDHSAHARLEGRGKLGRPPRPNAVDVLDQRLENLPRSNVNNYGGARGLDLVDELEHNMSKPKKKRPNLPRPPRGPGVAASSRVSSKCSSNAYEVKSEETRFSASAASGSQDDPISILEDDIPMINGGAATRVGGDAKRSKVMAMYGRSNSMSAMSTPASKSSLFVEENVHPNDTTETPISTRRSSRLEKKARMTITTGLSALDTSRSTNESHPALLSSKSITTRSRARANSKKRSATSATSDNTPAGISNGSSEQQQDDEPSPLRSASMASFSSGGSFASSSNSSIRNTTGSSGSESFSSLARKSVDQNWAISGKQQTSYQHKRSVSVSTFSSNGIGANSNISNNSALKTPSAAATSSSTSLHNRSISCGGDLSDMKSPAIYSPSFLSPETPSRGTMHLSTPSVDSTSSRKRRTMDDHFTSSPIEYDELGGSERTRSRSKMMVPPVPFAMMDSSHAIHEELKPTSLKTATSEPIGTMSMFSSPPPTNNASSFGKLLNNEMMCPVGSSDDDEGINTTVEIKDDVRDRLSSDNDDSMMSTESSDDDDDSAADSSEDDASEDEETPRQMTDAEIFESKSSYDDFKFLTKSLLKWSQHGSSGKGVASMGLNNGCLIAVPPNWTFEHRANFAKWVATSFGFRVGSVGGAGGSFLRWSDAEGKEVLARLRRILNDHKAGRLVSTTTTTAETNIADGGKTHQSKKMAKPKAKLPIKLSSTRRRSSFIEGPSLSFCDGMVGDLLADDMKGITLDEKKPPEPVAKTNNGNSSVPQFIRSMSLQPLANKFKNTTLPCFRNLSPTVGSGEKGRRSSGGGGRLPRLSSESAINGSDFINQLHGMGSPSPLLNRFPRRLREVCRPSLDSLRSSFERPILHHHHQQQGCLKPFESPHPRNNCLALETPSSRLEFGLETPMPKQVENWGSRPVFGKDWGESICCCDGTIDACSQIFAKSWFTSEFHVNEDLSAQYQMALDEDEESSLFAFYDADANLDDEDDDDDSELASINGHSLDEFPTAFASKKIGLARCDSVGASALDLLHIHDDKVNGLGQSPTNDRRRTMKLRKYARMSLCVAAASDYLQPKLKRCYRLSQSPTKKKSFFMNTIAFSQVLSFLNEGELIHSASLVSTRFADVAAEALGNLMLVSVGCDPSLKGKSNDDSSIETDESGQADTQGVSLGHSSVAKSMERGWPYLMTEFPWAQFLTDGSFKRVYKVWNNRCGAYEALSVMDVDAIDDLGNLNLVGTELAVSVILSSLARRAICPNFVVTRGVFTCQHEPPSPLWGCKEDSAPQGTSYDGRTQSSNILKPTPVQSGNYQYIRMELCENGDIEEHIKNHPDKMLATLDCRNLLFQMAFALHVAGDRFGLKHYDVKLLNFLLQSAKDPTISDDKHPHVVLRYGIGSRVFHLRMHPSKAHIAKLADYGTSVMRTDMDGQPVCLGQFTTLENTPPDFLILGNAAEQGYGHDCFGLGLCMLHLFTGHGPYEEILDEVFCPETLKGKLRKIWRQKSHDVIHSVMLDNDENGLEIEDRTLYDTLYRFLVIFGIPEKQFGIKKHGKVWRAINSTLLPPKGLRSNKSPDLDIFNKDRKKFSLSEGNDERIAHARRRLLDMDGAMELLLSLVSFDPKTRATPLDVINSRFMSALIEDNSVVHHEGDIVKSYTAYLTK